MAHHGRRPSKSSGTSTVGKSSAVPAQQLIKNRDDHTYERFLASSDPSAKAIVNAAIQDMIEAILMVYRQLPPDEREFPVEIANPIEVDGDNEAYPLPSSPEWNRRIGNHEIWLKGTIKIDAGAKSPVFHVDMTMTVKPLGHAKFRRCEIKRKFNFTIDEVETAPFGSSYTLQA